MGRAAPEPLELGVVTKPHGVRGELKVQLHWSESTVLADLDDVLLGKPSKPLEGFHVEFVRSTAKGALLKLAGIDSRDAAERLRGAHLYAKRAQLPPLDSDEYYLVDLLGFEVRSPSRVVGRVVKVNAHPTLDTVVIEDSAGRRMEQPLNDTWVDEIRFEERVVLLSSEDGLIDE